MQGANPSRYSTNSFFEKVRRAHREFEERKRKIDEFRAKYFCEVNFVHDFELYKPHPGCAKHVCKFCAEESQDKIFSPRVYAYKGRRFDFKAKHKFDTVRTYTL